MKPHTIRLLTLGLCLLATSAAQAGKLYKWEDDHGNVHYGDRVPPEYADQERKVLSDQGVTVETMERTKTAEERAVDERLQALEAEEEQRRLDRMAKDRVLLATFSKEEDLVMARDGKTGAIDAIITLTEQRILRVQQQLDSWTSEAASLERSGVAVPDHLKKNIASANAQIQHNLEYIQSQREEQDIIRRRFADDIERFRYLKAATGRTEDSPAANSASTLRH